MVRRISRTTLVPAPSACSSKSRTNAAVSPERISAEGGNVRWPRHELFNCSEKRLARTLLLLARYGEPDVSHPTLPKVSQEVLAEMVGTTRSRVNVFMNKFRKLGFIDYNGGLKVNNSLLSVVLRD
jgi:CRP-like cAMP-binding protein